MDSERRDSSLFFKVSGFLNTAERQRETANEAYSHYILERLQTMLLSLSGLMGHLRSASINNTTEVAVVSEQYYADLSELVICVRGIYSQWEHHIDELARRDIHDSYSAPLEEVSHIGRPHFDITREQVEHLPSMSFPWSQIAKMLGVSRSTLYRRRVEFDMIGYARENITDDQLHSILYIHLRQEMPSLGETMTWGKIYSMGFVVRRERLRQAIRGIDPLHTSLRWRGYLTGRRPYSIPGPNSLWHLGKYSNGL